MCDDCGHFEDTIASLESEIETLNNDHDSTVDDFEARIRELESDLDDITEERNTESQKAEDLEASLCELQEEFRDYQDEIATEVDEFNAGMILVEQANEREAENDRLRSRIDELLVERDDLLENLDHARKVAGLPV